MIVRVRKCLKKRQKKNIRCHTCNVFMCFYALARQNKKTLEGLEAKVKANTKINAIVSVTEQVRLSHMKCSRVIVDDRTCLHTLEEG